jgi:hypothetical protein
MLVTTTRHPSLIIKGKIKAWLQATPQRKVPAMSANIRQNQKLVTVTNTQGYYRTKIMWSVLDLSSLIDGLFESQIQPFLYLMKELK